MRKSSRLKGGGYLVSSASVVLLAVPALDGAKNDPVLLGCLLGGVVLSIAGMGLRWRSHRIEIHRKETRLRRPTKGEEGWRGEV